jgi:tetratricopeptide (TPR) repeat protein
MYEWLINRYITVEIGKQHQLEIKSAIDTLVNTLKQNPDIWSIRKEVARLLFDNSRYKEAADIVWSAPEIPAVDLEIAFAARVLSRAQPRRAIRLLQHVQEKAVDSPAKLLAIANALMHYGMVLQAAKFYGAATAQDSSLANGDLEHFMLWLDDSQRLWGDWEKDGQKMERLPWVKRDQAKEGDFEKMMSGLTTPIVVPGLKESSSEHLVNEYYRQVPIRDGEITAPPAVTVPLDQLKPDDVIHDDVRGASITPSKEVPRSYARPPKAMERPEKTSVEMALPVLPKKPAAVVEDTVEEPEKKTEKEAEVDPKNPKFLF